MKGRPGAPDVRLQRPHRRRAGLARRVLRRGRHPARPADPPGAVARSRTGRRSPSCSSRASWSAAATSSARCTRRASWPRRSGSSRRPTPPRRRRSRPSRAPRPSRSATTSLLSARRSRPRPELAAGDGNEQPPSHEPPPLATAGSRRHDSPHPPGVVAFAVVDARTGASAATTLDVQFRSASMTQGDAAGRRAAPRRRIGRSPPGAAGLLDPMITASDNNAGAQGLRDGRRRSACSAVGHAARMTPFRPRRRRVRDPHHRRRPGALLPADRPARPRPPPRLRPRAAGRHHRPAALGHRARRAIPPLPVFFKGGWRKGITHQARYWSGTAAGSRSRSSRADEPTVAYGRGHPRRRRRARAGAVT